MKHINTNGYNYYIIADIFGADCNFKRSSNMRVICKSLFQAQHMIMKKMLIPSCKNSSDRYYFNILRSISIIYHICIKSELYNLAYGKFKFGPIKWNFKAKNE